MERLAYLLAVVVLCSCSASKPGQVETLVPQGLRTTSGWQFQFEGIDYWTAENGRNLVNHSLELDGGTGLAYALYSIGGFSPITDLDSLVITLPALHPLATDSKVYVGISDYGRNAWKWFDTELPDFQLAVGPGDNFVSSSGVLQLAVVLYGDTVTEVDALELVGDTQPEWVEEIVQAIPGIFEPSGICMAPDNLSMFIADDGNFEKPSGLAEVDLAFNLLRRIDLGSDLEGVCYCPVDGLLYVVDESAELVFMVHPGTLTLIGTFYYSRFFGDDEVIDPDDDGVEDIAFIPDAAVYGGGYFLLLNQNDPTALLRIDRGDIDSNPPETPAPLSGFTLVEDRTAGGLYFDAPKRHLWVVHSWMDFVEVYNIDTMKLVSRDNFPGFAQEGVTLDASGTLWVCNDMGFLGKYNYVVP